MRRSAAHPRIAPPQSRSERRAIARVKRPLRGGLFCFGLRWGETGLENPSFSCCAAAIGKNRQPSKLSRGSNRPWSERRRNMNDRAGWPQTRSRAFALASQRPLPLAVLTRVSKVLKRFKLDKTKTKTSFWPRDRKFFALYSLALVALLAAVLVSVCTLCRRRWLYQPCRIAPTLQQYERLVIFFRQRSRKGLDPSSRTCLIVAVRFC
jgi:hypothetical protein